MAAAGVLHRQGVFVSDRGEDETGRGPERKGSGGVAAHPDRPGLTGAGDPVDRRAPPAGEGQSREGIPDRAGPAGKRMRVPGVTTLEAANQYLETEFVP